MKQNSKNLIYFVLVILLGLVCLLGVVLPENKPVRAVDNLQLSAFKNGLSLFQADRNFYYTFSPFNDYYVLDGGSRISIITKEEIFADKFTINPSSHLTNLSNSLEAYFNVYLPLITFFTDKGVQIDYTTEVAGQTLIVTNKLRLPENINPALLGTTITYNADDFVFDKEGNLYTYQSDEDINLFAKIYGVKLTYFNDEPRIALPDQAIFIVNPKLSSVLLVRAGKTQTIFLNRQNKIIELEQKPDQLTEEIISSIQVEVFEDLKEAFKKI